MPIPNSIADLSTTVTLNSPQGGDPVGGNIDNYFRAHAALIKKSLSKGAFGLTSQSQLPVPADGLVFTVEIVGATINSFANVFDGRTIILHFTGVCTLVHSANLVLPTGGNIATISGDIAMFTQLSTGVWVCVSWDRASAAIAVSQSATAFNAAITAAIDAYKATADTKFVEVAGDTMTGTLVNKSGQMTIQGWAGDPNQGVLYLNEVKNRYLQYNGSGYKLGGAGLQVDGAIFAMDASLQADGNLYGTVWGGWLSTYLNARFDGRQPAGNYAHSAEGRKDIHWNGEFHLMQDNASGWHKLWTNNNFNPASKANAGSQVQHGVGITEFGSIRIATPQTLDLPGPWVVTSFRTSADAQIFFVRGVWLVNQ